jgi:energy-coupling factor transporter ATP-binding protein EcfA2/GNAT superfamily N-acetyltransferase
MLVKSVQFDDLQKRFRLENGRRMRTHRFACLGPGDDVVYRGAKEAHVCCRNGNAKLLPLYEATDYVKVGKRRVALTVKEIETEDELRGYNQLARYHYRGKNLHGRRTPLILVCHDPLLPSVLGYIELSSAFLMNKPRATLLNAPLTDSESGISWTGWNKDTVRRYTNLVVRIARTVVSPEFRGLGLASLLVQHAAVYAREHWNVGGLKPLFIEITADMLRYVPFVERAGMHYVGLTEGNLERVTKDMTYVLRNLDRVRRREILNEESAGIVDLQVSYAMLLNKMAKRNKLGHKSILELLLHDPHRLPDHDWTMLHRVFRLPKPTFLMGLTPAAEAFVTQRVKALGLPKCSPTFTPDPHGEKSQSIVHAAKCSFSLSATIRRTRSTRRVQEAFGIDNEMMYSTLFADLSFKISRGEIVLVCGPSGAGKTTLVSLLQRKLVKTKHRPDGLSGRLWVRPNLDVSVLQPLGNGKPLIDGLGASSFDESLYALNVSGLAEAHLYLKSFSELSNGQRYRAMMAKLIASNADVWIADEFCATLDPVTASIVARNLRRCAKRLNVTVVLAAASWGDFIHELKPDTVIHLRSPWDYRVFSWSEFEQSVAHSMLSGLACVPTGKRHAGIDR